MNKYESPMILMTENLAEGVYASGLSGSTGDCMRVKFTKGDRYEQVGEQYKFNGSFEYQHVSYDHCNTGCYITVTFPCKVTLLTAECSNDIKSFKSLGDNTWLLEIRNGLHAASNNSSNFEHSTANIVGYIYNQSDYELIRTGVICTITDDGKKNYDCPTHKNSYNK